MLCSYSAVKDNAYNNQQMTRFIIFICLITQVMVANAAFASTRCAHANMGQMTHAMTADSNSDAAQANAAPVKHQCKCFCDIVGHCAAAAAGVVASFNANIDDFPPLDIARSTPTGVITNAHKTRLDRPPSSS